MPILDGHHQEMPPMAGVASDLLARHIYFQPHFHFVHPLRLLQSTQRLKCAETAWSSRTGVGRSSRFEWWFEREQSVRFKGRS